MRMASKLYPTLSAFYRAENIGFGSEKDAILCGVPDEKLYRKPSRQRAELPVKTYPEANPQPEQPLQHHEAGVAVSASPAHQHTSMSPSRTSPTHHNTSASPTRTSPALHQNTSVSPTRLGGEGDMPPLTPSAPPLLEMLDARLQQYLDLLLASTNNQSPPTAILAPTEDLQSSTQHTSNTNLPPNSDAALTLPPDELLDELQPDYDDLSPEEMAEEILNNLNVVREEDAKYLEKSLSILRTASGQGPLEPNFDADVEEEEEGGNQREQQHQHDHRARHSYHHQPSVASRDDNEDTDIHVEHHHHHHQRQHSKPRGAGRLQVGESREDLRAAGRPRRQREGEEGSRAAQREAEARPGRREAGYPHRPPHRSRGKPLADPRGASTGLGLDQVERSGARGKTAAAAAGEKENRCVSPGKSAPHGDNSDYNAWMTWRKQVNRQLATVILLKQQGRQVKVQNSDMRRKPLRKSSIDFVSQIATQTGSSTSLGGKPYVMYGIPRASLLSGSAPTGGKNDK